MSKQYLHEKRVGRTAVSEYDIANRPMRVTHMEGAAHLYTGEVSYDRYSNLSAFREKVGADGTAYRTDFSYDRENKPTLIIFGDANNKVAYAYDALGRLSTRTATVGGNAATSTYSYVAGGHGSGSTTNLIASISQGNGESCSYTYDNVGNIASSTRGSRTTTYAYDNMGQLIRVNDPAENATWAYEYDRGGNILNKKKYAYTTGTVGAVVQTIVYAYGDANWKDKLTAYNGVGITYDQIGNPLNDGTWTYQWEKGRQLKQMAKSGTTAAYAYNHDGLRIRKTVNGVVTNYTLHGKNVVHMTQGANDLHFRYDANGKPAVVEFNGTKYAYIHNLQGDILGIRDVAGNEVLRYAYDAWGKLLETTGSLATTLGKLNPFRYRGYVYDEETGLYYLRSRYYNPVWGRFVNADAIIQGSLFVYCKNSPLLYTDKTGNAPNKTLTPIISRISVCIANIIAGITTPSEQAASEYSRLNPGKEMLDITAVATSQAKSTFRTSTSIYNWKAKVAYDVAQAASDISSEIGSTVDALLHGYGIPVQPGQYIDASISIASEAFLPDVPPATHEYNTYTLKHEYSNSVEGFKYVSIEQTFYSCNDSGCHIHNSGVIQVHITVSNDILPFYYGTRKDRDFYYNAP